MASNTKTYCPQSTTTTTVDALLHHQLHQLLLHHTALSASHILKSKSSGKSYYCHCQVAKRPTLFGQYNSPRTQYRIRFNCSDVHTDKQTERQSGQLFGKWHTVRGTVFSVIRARTYDSFIIKSDYPPIGERERERAPLSHLLRAKSISCDQS